MSNPNYASIATATIESRTRALADNVTTNNALLGRLKERGRKKTVSGGTKILQEIQYASNTSSGWYSGYDTLTTAATDVLTAAEYAIKEGYALVTISGLEMAQNRGKEQMLDLLEARIENAEATLSNLIAVGVYSDGTANSGKQIGGLQLLVANTPTSGTVGNINRATYSYWRNLSKSAATDYGAAKTSANVLAQFGKTFNQLVRGADAPDLIVSDANDYGRLTDAMTDRQIVSDPKMAEAGFTTLKYRGADVVLDGGIGGACPADTSYFLNTKYLFYRPIADHDMYTLDGDRSAYNQDALVKIIGWKGNLTMSGAQFQGIYKA
jgi:hypothetical protein